VTFGLGIAPTVGKYLISITILSICISNRSSVASGHQAPTWQVRFTYGDPGHFSAKRLGRQQLNRVD
jgi:hypothetical protein